MGRRRAAAAKPGPITQALLVAAFELPIVLYLAVVGVLGLLFESAATPNTLDDSLPTWMVVTWATFLAAGGAVTVAGLLRQAEPLEAIGLVLLVWPCSLYSVVLVASAGGPGIAAALAYLALVSACGLRLWVLYKSRQTRRVAHAIATSEGTR